MKQENEGNAAVAQAASEWQKKRAHQEIMAKLSTVTGYYSMEQDYDQYPVRQWNGTELPEDVLKEVMERGDTTEIVYMIYRYGEMIRERGYGSVLPVSIQILIVKRNNFEEVDAYTAYQGFCEEAQEIILSEWSHERILHYVSQHGLAPSMQRKLLVRQDKDEIAAHIKHHGLDNILVAAILTELQISGDYTLFYLFIENHELPIVGQRLMLSAVNSKAFSDYISCYGLWDDVHEDLLRVRPVGDIKLYFERHHYLCPKAEDMLVRFPNHEERHELVMSYIKNWKNSKFFPKDHFLTSLLLAPELDYEALSKVFIALPYTDTFLYEEAQEDIELMAKGDENAVMARFESGEPLHIRALTELFYRNEPKWFEAYIANCTGRICYRY